VKMLQLMVAWTPTSGEPAEGETPGDIKVGPWPDEDGWSDNFSFTDGACTSYWHEVDASELAAQIFILFNAVVLDGVDPHKAHNAFLAIDEYCERIPPDMPRWQPKIIG
jgi:hypothetical protein